MLYQPPLTRDHLWGRHMYLIQPTTMSVFHVNSQMPMQWEDTAFFFYFKICIFYFKICIYIYYASKNDSTIFFSNLLSTYLELDPFNWPTLPLIFFFPHALTTGSRFVSQREALYQEEGSFLTWMNSLTKLEANISCSYSINFFCYTGFIHGVPKTAHSKPDLWEDNQSGEAQKSQLRDMNMSLFLWEKLLP